MTVLKYAPSFATLASATPLVHNLLNNIHVIVHLTLSHSCSPALSTLIGMLCLPMLANKQRVPKPSALDWHALFAHAC